MPNQIKFAMASTLWIGLAVALPVAVVTFGPYVEKVAVEFVLHQIERPHGCERLTADECTALKQGGM